MKWVSTLSTIAVTVAVSLPGAVSAQSYTPNMRYPNPDGDLNVVKRRGPCGDPWVTVALEIVYGRADASKCNVKLYNNGQWDSFNTLVHAVAREKNAGSGSGSGGAKVTIDLSRIKYQCSAPTSCTIFSNGGEKVGMLTNGNFQPEVPQKMVAAGGGNILGNAGSNMVAAGGGNMVAAGGGNMVAAGGGNIVAAGAGNVIAQRMSENPPVSAMGGYSLQGVNDFRGLQQKTRGK